MRNHTGLFRSVRLTVGLSVWGGVAGLCGCAAPMGWPPGGWFGNYDKAEHRMRAADRPLLIRYIDNAPGEFDVTQSPFADGRLRKHTREYVRCLLVKSHEPDRRYVAQFGVERAPAVIIVHRDGTYHSHDGAMTAEGLVGFLAQAIPPGKVRAENPYVPRGPRYEWHHDVSAARQEAEAGDRSLLIVYFRRFGNDWRVMNNLLSRYEVYRRLTGMVHCQAPLWNTWAKTAETPFGDVQLPALVIVDAGGEHHVLERPLSYEAVVEFADRARSVTAGPGVSAHAAVTLWRP